MHMKLSFVFSMALATAFAACPLAVPRAWAQTCIQDKAGKSLVCTANDVRIAGAENVRDLQGQPLSTCISGQTFSFIADFRVLTGATARYDVGLFFATDGDSNHDGARSGVCSVNKLDPKDANTGLGSTNYVSLDSDGCGDINTANNPQIDSVRVDNVVCQDSDGDGRLNLPNCTSWSQNSGGVCTTADNTVPGSPSKCSCDIAFNIGIRVESGSLEVTKSASPASRPEPGGEFTFSVGVENTAGFTSVTVERICDDHYGTVAKIASAPACPAGSLGTINSTTCVVPQTLAGGGTYNCSFKGNVLSNLPLMNVTDVVTVFGRDSNTPPQSVQGSDSAQVSITDVAPTASVVKSLVGLACADVNYRVRVDNTDTAEALQLTTLSDSGFGSVTSVHDAVLATTCTVPQTIAASGSYECDFRAHFCGDSHIDTVTGSLKDDENTVINRSSNSLQVDVGAALHQPQP
jgi:hypothetical protein